MLTTAAGDFGKRMQTRSPLAAGLKEEVGQLVAGGFQLAVGEGFLAHDDGGSVLASFCLLGDPTLEQSVHLGAFFGKRNLAGNEKRIAKAGYTLKVYARICGID